MIDLMFIFVGMIDNYENGVLIKGDSFDGMNLVGDGLVSLIIADLPYGKTKNPWDVVIPPEMLFPQYWRVLKPNGIVVLFGQDKFTAMMMLADKNHRYNLIWKKTKVTGHLNSGIQPLRNHEDMMVFYQRRPTYNPQKTTGHPRKVSSAAHKRNGKATLNYGAYGLTSYDSTERFPTSVWEFKSDTQKSSLHSTQKPVLLIEEIIKTYSNKGDLVLDNVGGVFTTPVACINTGRKFVSIEKYDPQFTDGLNRVNDHCNKLDVAHPEVIYL